MHVPGKRIGVLTGGGDCPGLNAAIRAVAKGAIKLGYEVIGFIDGMDGLMEGRYQVLGWSDASGIIDRGGTILGSSGINASIVERQMTAILKNVADVGLEALVIIGGNSTMGVALDLQSEGIPVVGIPKTIDNDVKETDFAIGFQTAVQVAVDALDRIRTTAESHHRVMILEVMGRDTGWIATYAGLAGGADAILIPEVPTDVDKLCDMLKKRNERGKRFSIVVIAEGTRLTGDGAVDPRQTGYGKQGGVGVVLERIVQERTGLDPRVTLLGHVQRGGTPTAFDRILATALGLKAVELIASRKYGEMAAVQGNAIVSVPLDLVANQTKTVDLNLYRTAEVFFG
ncbi:MAG: ATP-dependent 6-phosphofructokinase [Chloroflexi bacterium]|nr:ATP-dependent 6-phosphofructokinase [Chloroflexota bacterium]